MVFILCDFLSFFFLPNVCTQYCCSGNLWNFCPGDKFLYYDHIESYKDVQLKPRLKKMLFKSSLSYVNICFYNAYFLCLFLNKLLDLKWMTVFRVASPQIMYSVPLFRNVCTSHATVYVYVETTQVQSQKPYVLTSKLKCKVKSSMY